MTTAVAWWNSDPASPPGGYWDQGMVEDLLAGTLWRTTTPYEFRWVIADTATPWALPEGVIVIVPGDYNAGPDALALLNAWAEAAPWVLFIITGDELGKFDATQLTHPKRRVWKEGTFLGGAAGVDVRLPIGYPPWFRAAVQAGGHGIPPRPYDVTLWGQYTHERRIAAFNALAYLPPKVMVSQLRTPGFTQGQPPMEYAKAMAMTKVALAPSGPDTPESFRLYEALEAGCIPVVDAASPRRVDHDYWLRVLGQHPLPTIRVWSDLPGYVERLLDGWPANAARVSAWWQQWKRDLAYLLYDTLVELGAPRPTADDSITVLVTTSPVERHPRTDHIEEVIASIRARLPLAEIVIVADGVREEQAHLADAYSAYLHRLTWLCNHVWSNVVPVIADKFIHQAASAQLGLQYVHTRFVLFMEHDTPLVREPIDWVPLTAALADYTANVIRLPHEHEVLDVHRHLMIGGPEVIGATADSTGAVAWRTRQWSQRPHLARARWYRTMLASRCAEPFYIEDQVYSEVEGDTDGNGWRIWLLQPEGNTQRSIHLDSREGAPKYE